MFMVVLGLPAPYNFSEEKTNLRCLEHHESRCPKTQKDQSYRTTFVCRPRAFFSLVRPFHTEKSRRTSEVFFTGSLTVHADWRHARNAGFCEVSSSTFRWRLLTHGLTSFATDMGILRWKWRNFQVVFFFCKHGVECCDVEFVHPPYSPLWSRETLPTCDTELETLLDQNAWVL